MSAAKGSTPWNAGTSKGWTDKRGYRWIYVDENGKRRARREHRVVMERHLGRRLEPWELVHHRDENPANNAIDNLELKEFAVHTAEHHKGTRRDADARRSMEAFALMREELKAERALKAELLEALQGLLIEAVVLSDEYLAAFESYPADATIQGWDKARWLRAAAQAKRARAAIAAATGQQPDPTR